MYGSLVMTSSNMFFHAHGYISVNTQQLHMTFCIHLHSVCYSFQSKCKIGSNTHVPMYSVHSQYRWRCILYSYNNHAERHSQTHKYTLAETYNTHNDVYQDRVMEHSGWAKQTYTCWLAPMGEATGPPVWLLSLTSPSFFCKQTTAVWNTRSCCMGLKLFHLNCFLC